MLFSSQIPLSSLLVILSGSQNAEANKIGYCHKLGYIKVSCKNQLNTRALISQNKVRFWLWDVEVYTS